MESFVLQHYRPFICAVMMAGVSLLHAGCTSNTKKADEDAARYAELEGDLIRTNEEEEIRRRNEMRVAEKLRQMSAGLADSSRQHSKGADTSRLVTSVVIENDNSANTSNSRTPADSYVADLQEPLLEQPKDNDLSQSPGEATDTRAEALANSVANSNGLQTPISRTISSADVPPDTAVVMAGAESDGVDESSAEQGIWTFKDHPNPLSGALACAVVSEPVVVKNGALETIVRVIIMTDAIYLRTDATFDINASDTGYRVDAGFPVSFNDYANELTAVVDKDYDRLYQMITSGLILTAEFAYMPQLVDTKTHRLELNLDGIEGALGELDACRTKDSSVKDG